MKKGTLNKEGACLGPGRKNYLCTTLNIRGSLLVYRHHPPINTRLDHVGFFRGEMHTLRKPRLQYLLAPAPSIMRTYTYTPAALNEQPRYDLTGAQAQEATSS